MKTFEQVVENQTPEVVYSGTSVNTATQGALMEWLFDLNICTDDDETKFCRYYRRYLNMYYPLYVDYLKLEIARSNMDPFITELMTRTHEDEKSLSGSLTRANTGTVSDSGRTEDTTESDTVRTPDLTSSSSNSNLETRDLSGTSSTSSTHEEESTENGKNRGVAIAYPEANLNSLPIDIDNMPTTVDYASSESDGFSKGEHTGESSDSGSAQTTDSGTVNNSGSGSIHDTGTETTEFDGSNIRVSSNTRTNNLSETATNSGSETNEATDTDEGRHESEADILPRAIKAVTSTNAIKWLVSSLQVCFDNYSEM